MSTAAPPSQAVATQQPRARMTGLQYALQAVCYGAFVAFVGYFSNSPTYVHLPPGQALVKLSLQHAGQRKEPCRQRSAEELAKLAPNMRTPAVCPRERAPVVVEVDMDGRLLFSVVAPPSGFAKDGASTVYRRAAITAGRHRFAARLKDAPAGNPDVQERTIDVRAGQLLLLDYSTAEGGWIFRG